MATEVNWEDEKECFEIFARETAQFYSCKEAPGARYDILYYVVLDGFGK